MKLIHSRLIALGLTLGIAGVVGAYTPPTTGAFGVNTDAPINTSALDQDKSGGLSVTVFQARACLYLVGNSDAYWRSSIIIWK